LCPGTERHNGSFLVFDSFHVPNLHKEDLISGNECSLTSCLPEAKDPLENKKERTLVELKIRKKIKEGVHGVKSKQKKIEFRKNENRRRKTSVYYGFLF
jgi:hypothetical protein